MKIVQLTPGTGNFYCGTCIRDNTLVRALRRLGHDALILPMYLPMVTDRSVENEDAPIFFGGINVYLEQKFPLWRRTPAWVGRLLDSPALLRSAARRAGMTRARDLGEMTISMLRGEQGYQSREIDKLLAWLGARERPDLICLSNVLLAGLARRLHQSLGVPVVCALQGEDCFLDSLPQPYRNDAWRAVAERARDIDAFIAISHYFGELMRRRLALPPAKVHVVHNGIDLEGYSPAPSQPAPPPTAGPRLGYLARLSAGKGLGMLVEAFILLRQRPDHRDLRLCVAGTMTAEDERYVGTLRERLGRASLLDAVEFHPNVDRARKIELLESLTVFSVPATYGEAFGLYVLEALAAGVPVVAPRHAAFPELLEATGGGLLCAPDDPAALAGAIDELLRDPTRARALGERGREAVVERFGDEHMAREALRVFESVLPAAAANDPAPAQDENDEMGKE